MRETENDKTAATQDWPDNMPLEEQVDRLATLLLDRFGGPTRSEGAIEMACRLLNEQADEISDLRFLIGMALDKHGHSAWRGHVLRVSPHLLRRLRAAALGGREGEG